PPGFVSASGQGSPDVFANPLFAGPWDAPPATNLALAKGSPAIGVGVTLLAVMHDYLGAPRPAKGTDIGAFQYGAVVAKDGGLSDGSPGTPMPDGGTGDARVEGGSPVKEGGGGGGDEPGSGGS